ncbi:hypothetical protein HBN50_14585 [Halobacteriovorax sp. GB3]|uniref:hypothetical protein n=1 Tax=Halobacteriovorax sp. GB3 TaxID=2719615 RepID=UPI00235DD54D|nr:hypothetical protein [Halobacteriovorax sp. GB3]MDD0854336.1 hypothetical protein [Halobacteriovorax sp. GB3]
MNLRKNLVIVTRLTLAVIYFWVVADRLGLLGKAGNMGVVWGNFDTFLDYTATLNAWMPRAVSDILGYLATIIEIVLGVLLMTGIRLKEASLVSASLLIVFTLSMVVSLGISSSLDFIIFTLITIAASAFIYFETTRRVLDSSSPQKVQR